jgi:hypothetical protein
VENSLPKRRTNEPKREVASKNSGDHKRGRRDGGVFELYDVFLRKVFEQPLSQTSKRFNGIYQKVCGGYNRFSTGESDQTSPEKVEITKIREQSRTQPGGKERLEDGRQRMEQMEGRDSHARNPGGT